MESKFIMLPNKLVWVYENREDTYLYKYGDKIINIFTYLQGKTDSFGGSSFTIKDLIVNSGEQPKRGKNKNIEQFRNILINLEKKDIIQNVIIDSNIDNDKTLENCKITDYICCTFNITIEKDENNNNINFFNIDVKKYIKIMCFYKGKCNKLTLLKIYYYINARLKRRKNIEINGKKMNTNNIEINGGKAVEMHEKLNNIARDLNITEKTLIKYLKELKNMNLILYGNIGKVQKDGKITTANNVYCLNNESELKEALKQSKLYYLKNGYKVFNKSIRVKVKVNKNTDVDVDTDENIHGYGYIYKNYNDLTPQELANEKFGEGVAL